MSMFKTFLYVTLSLCLFPSAFAMKPQKWAFSKLDKVRVYNQDPLAQSLQTLVVKSNDASWNSPVGHLQRYERASLQHPWQATGQSVRVTLGSAGLAWGRGLHVSPLNGPYKVEGDKRAPAGVFALLSTFGQDELPAEQGNIVLPHIVVPAPNTVRCVDKTTSPFYNSIIFRNQFPTEEEWNQHSGEEMYIPLYQWGVIVGHNHDAKPGKGSCIFMHLWRDARSPTVGCTAMAESAIVKAISWINADKNPTIVQLPVHVYDELKTAWKLP